MILLGVQESAERVGAVGAKPVLFSFEGSLGCSCQRKDSLPTDSTARLKHEFTKSG